MRSETLTLAGTMVVSRRSAESTVTATEVLFRRHYGEMVGLAGLLVGDRGTAEEVVQDAFARFHLSRHRITDPDREVSYLRSIVCNMARSRLRRLAVERRLRPVPRAEVEPAPDVAGNSHRREAVAAALAALPRRQRECVVLRYWVDLPEREIAETLGIAPGSVKSHLHRGLGALGDRLEDLR